MTARDYVYSLQTDRWGTPRQRPPLEEDPQAITHRVCRRREGVPLGKEEWGDTGPADSVDIDSGPPMAATLGLTIVLDGEEEVAATGATSLGSTSLHSNSLRARERVKWYAIIDNEESQRQ